MGPPSFFATLNDLHGPPWGELPIGAWATLMIARYPKLNAKAAQKDKNHGKAPTFPAALTVGFQGMAPVSDGGTKNPGRIETRQGDAPSAHRRPGYSSSGCTPAEPDSASPGDPSLTRPEQARNGSRADSDGSLDSREVAKHKFLKVPRPDTVG